jgi:hypothetical protein
MIGAGLYAAGDVTITNVTVVDNVASGATTPASGGGMGFGAAYGATTLALRAVTLTRNTADVGGGLALLQTAATTTGAILSGNSAPADADCTILGGRGPSTLVSSGGNVVGSAATCGLATTATDVVASDPGVGALADNGGPTPTGLLSAASPGLDLYTADCPGLDQRGIARPQGSACDAGAVEMRAATFTAATGSLAFGSVAVGSTSPTQDVTITNAGDFAGIPPLTLAGADADQFSLSGCTAALAGGASCAASVGFAPTTAGAKVAGIDGPAPAVGLGGTGVAAPPPTPPAGGGVPQCRDLVASTPFATALGIELECTATVWNWAITHAPRHGTLSPITSEGQVGYTPDPGFSGDDSFRYVAESGGGQSAPATVVVHVGAGPATTASSGATAGSCPTRRVTVRLNPRGVHFVRAKVSVDGAPVKAQRDGTRWTASFDATGTVTVHISGRRGDGGLSKRTRTLTVC